MLITGDIGHHDGIDAIEKGINIIDAGHFGIEKIFIRIMKLYIGNTMKELEVLEDEAQKDFIIL